MKIRILGIFILLLASIYTTQAQDKLYPTTFPLADVKLLDGPFKHAQYLNISNLLKYDVNRLLAPYLAAAGLTPKGASYPNWIGLDGHVGGHYLSSLAIHYAATGNTRCKGLMDTMIIELRKCQVANAADTNFIGYLGGVPDGKTIWKKVINGDPTAVASGWVPWYNVHKMYAGLRDAWLYGGIDTAKYMFLQFCDWGIKTCSKLSDAQMETMLNTEHGGMNEIYADAYQMTGNSKYLVMSKRFSHKLIYNSMAAKIDNLDNKHANTQVPKAVGFQRIAELSNDVNYTKAARFFWETVSQKRSLASGGNSRKEFFPQASACGDYVTDREGPESCNTNNMLKLSEGLFRMSSEAKYADFYERALFNHILSTQHPEHGGYVYFTSARPRHYRVYSAPNQAMWCCVGTGMENHGKYGEFIYTHHADTLFTNLFIPSELNWKEKGVTITQETSFPEGDSTQLTIHVSAPTSFKLMIRHPKWVAAGAFKIVLGTDTLSISSQPSSYALIDRTWNDGDVVKVILPMQNTIESLPNVSRYIAVMHGPILLGAKTGTEDLAGLVADDSRWGHIANGSTLSLDKAPIMVGERSTILSKIKPVAGHPLNFTIHGLFASAVDSQLVLEPFYRIHDSRYMMYWMALTQTQYQKVVDSLAIIEKAKLILDKRTIDAVAPGEQQPEVDHSLQSLNSSTGNHQNEFWRDCSSGGFISYNLLTNKETKLSLMVRYWGNESGSRTFDILIDGVKLTTENIVEKWNKSEFVNVEYAIPDARVAGKNSVVVRFQPLSGNYAGGLFYVRMLRNVPNTAGIILGPLTVCKGRSGVTYSVSAISGATSYVWSLPEGAVGSDTTNSITLNFDSNLITDTIKVFGKNSYSAGNKSIKLITVGEIPSTPLVTYNTNILQSSIGNGNQWYLNNVAINGATASTYSPIQTGNYSVIIDPNGCPSDTSNIFYVTYTGIDELKENNLFRVSPNPTSGKIYITITKPGKQDYVIELLNNHGELLLSHKYEHSKTVLQLNISQYPSGIYFLRYYSGSESTMVKMIRQ